MCEGYTVSTVCLFCFFFLYIYASVTQSEIISTKAWEPVLRQFGGVREAAAAGRNKPCGTKAFKSQRSGQAAVSYDCSHLLKSALPAAASPAFPAAEPIKPPVNVRGRLICSVVTVFVDEANRWSLVSSNAKNVLSLAVAPLDEGNFI